VNLRWGRQRLKVNTSIRNWRNIDEEPSGVSLIVVRASLMGSVLAALRIHHEQGAAERRRGVRRRLMARSGIGSMVCARGRRSSDPGSKYRRTPYAPSVRGARLLQLRRVSGSIERVVVGEPLAGVKFKSLASVVRAYLLKAGISAMGRSSKRCRRP